MTHISAAHAAAMQAGRERKLAENDEAERARRDAFHRWIKADARLWRIYQAAEGDEIQRAHDEWHANLAHMPALPGASS